MAKGAWLPLILGETHQADADYLDTCRTIRNSVEYDYVGGATLDDAEELIRFVEELKTKVLEWLREKHRVLA